MLGWALAFSVPVSAGSAQSAEGFWALVGRLDATGLLGPPDGLRALDYEYCIASPQAFRDQVAQIDSTARFHEGSPGRIGCRTGEIRVSGNSHQPGFRAVIERLGALPYAVRIEPIWFE